MAKMNSKQAFFAALNSGKSAAEAKGALDRAEGRVERRADSLNHFASAAAERRTDRRYAGYGRDDDN